MFFFFHSIYGIFRWYYYPLWVSSAAFQIVSFYKKKHSVPYNVNVAKWFDMRLKVTHPFIFLRLLVKYSYILQYIIFTFIPTTDTVKHFFLFFTLLILVYWYFHIVKHTLLASALFLPSFLFFRGDDKFIEKIFLC